MSSDINQPARMVSGRAIVALMFAFGSVLTAGLWTYWYYHSAPFVPLQQAIAAEFPGSAPRVDGGQRKLHKGTPKLVWVILRVDFKPDEDDEQCQQIVRRVFELASENLDLAGFEQLNVRLFWGQPEKVIHKRDFEFPLHQKS